jgi:hypothetical protein
MMRGGDREESSKKKPKIEDKTQPTIIAGIKREGKPHETEDSEIKMDKDDKETKPMGKKQRRRRRSGKGDWETVQSKRCHTADPHAHIINTVNSEPHTNCQYSLHYPEQHLTDANREYHHLHNNSKA